MPSAFKHAFVISLIMFAAQSLAQPSMRYVYHAPESAVDVRYNYQWTILKTALDQTRAKWGPYSLSASTEVMTERRQAAELRRNGGKLTVMYLSPTPDFEKNLLPVRIPVDKNLCGYLLFLTKRESLGRFKSMSDLSELQQLTLGVGFGWVDVDIYRANGLRVVTGSTYDGLFKMLYNGRFDGFPRGANEIGGEYRTWSPQLPDLVIEPNVILYYPLPMYFWFSKSDEGKRLAARAEEGMRAMMSNGTYDKIFHRFYGEDIKRLNLDKRRVIRIRNPLLGPETPFSDRKLWFDPKTYRPPKV